MTFSGRVGPIEVVDLTLLKSRQKKKVKGIFKRLTDEDENVKSCIKNVF
jgi:hypothetical protein